MSLSELAVGAHRATTDGAGARLDGLLARLVAAGGSDLHLCAGTAPSMRVNGAIRATEGEAVLRPEDTEAMARHVLDDEQWQRFAATLELDVAYSLPAGRFRVNLYQQRGSVGAAFRAIPHEIRTLRSLDVPPAIENLAHLQRGLVLVTGPTGSGKSTTLASLLDLANRTRPAHIMTIEDPIEYLHDHQTAVVNQREVGVDTADFKVALRHALRQDPDIILVGELRDLETTQVAVTAAETGHLVFATLHTRSAATTVDRLIDIFPPDQQSQIRTQVAGCLQAVVAQALLPTADGRGRTAVCEVMLATPAIRNLVREAKVHQIGSAMQSAGGLGMISFDQHLAQRYHAGMVTREVALEHAHDPEDFQTLARLH